MGDTNDFGRKWLIGSKAVALPQFLISPTELKSQKEDRNEREDFHFSLQSVQAHRPLTEYLTALKPVDISNLHKISGSSGNLVRDFEAEE